MFGMIVVGLVCREAICVYFETVLRMNIRASRKEGKYIRALMVVDLAGLSFSTLCACLTSLLCYPCYPCCCPHVDTGCFLCLAFLPSLSRRALGFHLCSRFLPPASQNHHPCIQVQCEHPAPSGLHCHRQLRGALQQGLRRQRPELRCQRLEPHQVSRPFAPEHINSRSRNLSASSLLCP